MTADDRKRFAELLKGLVHEDEDSNIWALSSNKDILKEYFGFEVDSNRSDCICGHMFEKLRHNEHVFRVDTFCDWILKGKCPHVTTTSQSIQQTGTTFMHCACALGKMRVVKFLAYEHDCALKDVTKVHHFAPIHFAILNSNIELFDFLLSKRINVNVCCRGPDRYSTLMLAVLGKSEDVLKKILAVDGIQKNFVNFVQKGALCCAVEKDSEELVDILIHSGVMATPATLQRAQACGNDVILEKILQTRDTDFFLPSQQYDSLYKAIVHGRTKTLKILLEKGFKGNNFHQDSPYVEQEDLLLHAVVRNELEMVRLLVRHTSDVSKRVNGFTALDISRVLDFTDIAQYLEEEHRKRKLSTKKLKPDTNPFVTVLSLSDICKSKFISKLVSKGFDINAVSSGGFTPLHENIAKGEENVVQQLLNHGADPNRQSTDPTFVTPLQLSVIKGSVNMVNILLDMNVQMEIKRPVVVLWGSDTYHDNWITDPREMPRSRSALCDAICRSHVQIATTLLHAGFNLRKEDPSCLKWLINNTKSDKVRKLLLDHLHNPRSLGVICRDFIRKRCHQNLSQFVAEADIPLTLKHMLLLRDILKPNNLRSIS